MDKAYVCCVTGHRDVPNDQVAFLKSSLHSEILFAIEAGCTHFISGFAAGADLMFAEIVAELKKVYAITLEAAIPFPERMKTPDKAFQNLIRRCDIVRIHADRYSKSSYMLRNRYMVNCSCRLIAVYDGRQSGGTAATIRYAKTLGRTIRTICL